MQLPAPLLRRNPHSHKNTFGHVLVIAGSKSMLGAGALSSLAAMRSGAGLVTLGVPQSLNIAAQKKISSVVMTWPLPETKEQSFSLASFQKIEKKLSKFQALTIGPGLSQNPSTQKLIRKIISELKIPMIIDADALNALSKNTSSLIKIKEMKILTPHLGEMARLTGLSKKHIEANKLKVAKNFAKKYHCILLLKGHRTVVVAPDGKIYVNKTGNVGLATAGSGDVLTGIIAAFLAQGLSGFNAARWGAYVHGKAGDIAAKEKGRASLIATDIIENISAVLKDRKPRT
ncbi:MAG: NAD(P)H-hydrate dehydratase [Candidatus Aceula meridiana]|nr:NAD(P)H-hydrate dehydratase [Candidatus Aceula meridiana]